jgi:ureidoacrylate peracid hydrolase
MKENEIAVFQLYPNPKPENCAMIIVDPQNDFLNDEGWYKKEGNVDISHMQRTIEPIIKMVEFCRKMDIPIIVSQHGFRDANLDGGILCKVRPLLQRGGLRTGTWGGEIIEELGIDPKIDWTLPKSRLSCFYNTSLELILRGLGKTTLIMTGVLTNQCVESTIRDAQFRDLEVIELSDCVGTLAGPMRHPITKELQEVDPQDLHEASLRAVVFGLGDVVTSDELIGELNKNK